MVGGLGLFTKCLSVCMYVYRATIRNQHKTGQIYMLEKGFENLGPIIVFNFLFLQNLRTTKTVLRFHVVPMVALFNYVFRRHVIPRLSGGED